MAVTWLVNGVSPESKGLRLVGGSFRTQGTSHVSFDALLDVDAAEAFADGTSVTLDRVQDGVTLHFFQGRIKRITKSGSPDGEGHDYAIEDAWAELEETIYQEEWLIGSGAFLIPRAVLGICKNTLGTAYVRCNLGEQIRELIAFAAGTAGIDIQMGSCPDGEVLWPEEVTNLSIAEIIRKLLGYHPDWIPWLDHTTSPPTFNVTAASALTDMPIALAGDVAEGLQITRRADMLPDGVRIFYEFATTIDDEVFRNGVIDKYPLDAPDAGPRVINTTIPLKGMQMQTQKSPIQTRTIPIDHTDGTVKAYLKAKFPHLQDIPDAAFTVTKFVRSLVIETDEHPDPINPQAERIEVADINDLPRELVRGQINDWMRVKVGKIGIEIGIAQAGSWAGATPEARAAWKKGVRDITGMTATNALTKVYKGISQWAAPEDVPVGIAQAVYQSFHAACQFEGSIPLVEEEISNVRRYGKKVNITGGLGAWATMHAPVHSVDWDLETGRSVVGFGPVPQLAPQDFLELQRMIRQRTTRWWSVDERASNKVGGEGVPSAAGDSVVGYDFPETQFGTDDAGGDAPFSLKSMRASGGDALVSLHPGWIREILTTGAPGSNGVAFHMPMVGAVALNAQPVPEITMSFGDFLYVTYATDDQGNIKADPVPGVLASDAEEVTVHYQPKDGEGAGGADGSYFVKLGQLTGTSIADAQWTEYQNSDIEHYQELPQMKNIGTGASICKGRKPDANEYQIRRVRGRFGIQQEQETDSVAIDLLCANIGGGVAVFVGMEDPEAPEAGPAEIRTIRGLNETEQTAETISQQLRVLLAPAEDGTGLNKCILIRGNGVKLTKRGVTVEDGFVTAIADEDEEEGIDHYLVVETSFGSVEASTGYILMSASGNEVDTLKFIGGSLVAAFDGPETSDPEYDAGIPVRRVTHIQTLLP